MNKILRYALIAIISLVMSTVHFGQAPNLGAAGSFALFTSAGAFSNGGLTVVTGDIGTNVGAFSGFPPGVVIGNIHVADATTAQAAADLETAYAVLAGVTCGIVLTTTLGNGQVLAPNVYCLGGASVLNGDLILDGGGDPDAFFLFKIDGALSTNTLSRVILVDSASLCNVYWLINGAVALGETSVFRGNILANGAISLANEAMLLGRGLTKAGAIALENNVVTIGLQPTASVITANGPTTFCEGGSVMLSGNVGGTWSTGATTPSIIVSVNGDYFVTNTNDCGSVESNHIMVTVNPLPVCTISGNGTICPGQSTELCVPASSSYIWNTGATTNCITVMSAGTYSVTVTNANGCTSSCSKEVIVTTQQTCIITGATTICQGQSTQLCVPAGATGYIWSTGATTNCITVNTAGTYTVTVTNGNTCSSVCSATVTMSSQQTCTITGNSSICEGQSTQLCVPAGSSSYLWSTGATTNCITVMSAGTYSVTITDAGCTSICSKTVTVSSQQTCTITGNGSICQGQSTQLCVPAGSSSYLWSTGATTNCITVMSAGTYSVTITNAGCTSTCSKIVTVSSQQTCTITGNGSICQGQSTQLCVPAGSTSYLWSTGATTNCITVMAAGTYSVTINNAGCTSTCSKTVTVSSQQTCLITGNGSICQGQSTQLCVPAGSSSYLWSTGATTNCITVMSAGTYSVIITNAGCTSTCSKTVTVSSQQTCLITGNGSICQGQSTQLCVPAGSSSYLWSTGATTNCINVMSAGTYSVTINNAGCVSTCSKIVSNSSPSCTISGNSSICPGQSTLLCVYGTASTYLWSTGATTNCITVSSAGTYSITTTDATGCSSICSKVVTLNTQQTCAIAGNSSVCPGQSTPLCVPAGASSYLWSTGATTNCINVSAAGTYSVTITNGPGCISVCSKIITLSTQTTCTITGNGSICLGQSTQLCVPAGACGYLWSNGATTNCITVNSAGTYSVTVTNLSGCRSICSKIVTIVSQQTCIISGPGSICIGQPIQLCVPVVGCTSYLWSTGATTRCITVSTAGTYSVTATDPGGCRNICSKIITVTTPPPCIITGNSTICQGTSTSIWAPSGTDYTYLWNTGSTSRFITVNCAGTYTVTVSNGACISVCSKTITVSAPPPCLITGSSTICQGSTTSICAPSGTGYTYLWNTRATTRLITISTPGTYTVTVSNGGCSTVCCKTITQTYDIPCCTITGNSTVCQGTTTSLYATSGAGYTYLWNTGATTRVITINCGGTYSVTVSNGGCTSTCSKTVTVYSAPVCTITGSSTICQGSSTSICAPTGTGYTYLWNTGSTSRFITVSSAGTYSVTVNKYGCTSTCSKTITVSSPPNCSITGNLQPRTGESTTLCAPTGLSYLWSTGITSRCITVFCSGTYHVTLTNISGCTSTCCVTVSYINPRSASSKDDIVEGDGNIEVKSYPNPFNSKAIIEFKNTETTSHVVIDICDLSGNKISTLFDNNVEKGVMYNAELDAKDLSSGIYIYRIVNGNQIINKRITLIK